jgi:hypothetical protein
MNDCGRYASERAWAGARREESLPEFFLLYARLVAIFFEVLV